MEEEAEVERAAELYLVMEVVAAKEAEQDWR